MNTKSLKQITMKLKNKLSAALLLCALSLASFTSKAETFYITGSGSSFTARTDSVTGTVVPGADGVSNIQTVINAIKDNAAGKACTIQFEDGTNTLDIGAKGIEFNGGASKTDWGVITLTGKITSAMPRSSTSLSATILITNGVSVNSNADIKNTSIDGIGIHHTSTGTLTITGGNISVDNGPSAAAVQNSSVGLVIIGGNAKVSTTEGNSISNSSGTVIIGGDAQISIETGDAIHNAGGIVTIGDNALVSATTGRAIRTLHISKTTISGNAIVTSENTDASQGTICSTAFNDHASLDITGGTVSNTSANGHAVYYAYPNIVTITGGVVSAKGTRAAVCCANAHGAIVLGGDPDIIGRLQCSPGNLSVLTANPNIFAPKAGRVYMIDLNSYSMNGVVATDGAAFVNNFKVYDNNWGVGVSGNDIVVTNFYYLTGSGTSVTARRGSINGRIISGVTGVTVQVAVDAIKRDAAGEVCTIHFEDGTNTLNIGASNIEFNGGASGTDWGLITLKGKITSSKTTSPSSVIYMTNGVSVNSFADIDNTGYNSEGIGHNSTGTLTLAGGNVSANNGSNARAVINFSTGTVSIGGNAQVSAGDGDATRNNSTGTVSIDGKAQVKADAGRAIYNSTSGTVNIGGSAQVSANGGYGVNNNSTGTVSIGNNALVSVNGGYAVYNNSTGAVRIGDNASVSANAGSAIYIISTGKVIIADKAAVTSANTSATQGTISVSVATAGAATRLEITGGTVSNTSANGHAVYNASEGGVTITGGAVTAKGTGVSVYNNHTNGSIVLGGNPDITGRLRYYAGKLSVLSANPNIFAPATGKVYTLDLPSCTFNDIAVVNGKTFLNNFKMYDTNWGITVSENNLTVESQWSYTYFITRVGETIGARRGNITTGPLVGVDYSMDIQKVIDYIKVNTAGNACTIQFGDGTNTLDIGARGIEFNGGANRTDWGVITLTGKITSSLSRTTSPNAAIKMTNVALVNCTADIQNTGTGGEGIRNNSTGTLNITGGKISTTNGSNVFAIVNFSRGVINITGNTQVSSTDNAVYNATSNTINITGNAQISGVVNAYSGTVNIGGDSQVSGSAGRAVDINTLGKVTISNNATITSATTNLTSGTIYISNNITGNDTRLEINGGTVRNTAVDGFAVYNASESGVTITGGTISANGMGAAVYNHHANAPIVLGGNPTITGRIRYYSGKLSVLTANPNIFSPTAGKKYTLDFPSYTTAAVAVTNGAAYVNNFITSNTNWGVAASGSNLALASQFLYHYYITGSGTTFSARRGHITTGWAVTGAIRVSIQTVINAIKNDAAGNDCLIQFENGTYTLDIGSASISLDGGANGTDWGLITLAGKIVSSKAGFSNCIIELKNGVSVNSTADIENTGLNGWGITHISTGTLTVTGGNILALNGENAHTISNNSTGTVNISGDAQVQANAGTAIFNTSTGLINIGGNAVVTSARAHIQSGATATVYLNSAGANAHLNVTGGTIINTSATGNAISNNSQGEVTITGGTITANGTGAAVYTINPTGTIALGRNPDITGRLRCYAGKFSAIINYPNTFAASAGKVFTLELPSSALNNVAVTNGARYFNNFTISNNVWGLAVSGNNIVLAEPPMKYIITGSGTSFIARRANIPITVVPGANSVDIQTAINAIKTDVAGKACIIQFEDGASTLDIGATGITFDGSGSPSWGLITLEGKITSTRNTSPYATIYLSNGVSVNSTANIENTGTNGEGIRHNSAGTLTITGGAVRNASANSIAINNASSGVLLLGGNPTITGRINKGGAGNLGVLICGDHIFKPDNAKTYTLDFATYTIGALALENGSGFITQFTLANSVYFLAPSGNNLALSDKPYVAWSEYNPDLAEALITIEEGTFSVAQATANDAASIQTWLTNTINLLLSPSRDLQLRSSTTSITGALTVKSVSPAIAGTEAIKAWTHNGRLHVSGLITGEQWSVYNLNGILIYRNIAKDDKADAALPERGFYIIQSGNRFIKVMN
jgi:hypothetical protein